MINKQLIKTSGIKNHKFNYHWLTDINKIVYQP